MAIYSQLNEDFVDLIIYVHPPDPALLAVVLDNILRGSSIRAPPDDMLLLRLLRRVLEYSLDTE